MALRGLIALEIALEPAAQRNEAEQLAAGGLRPGLARIELLDRAAQFSEVGADARILVHRPHRPIEETVGEPGRRGDFLAPHRGQLVDPLAEFGAVGVLRHQIGDEGIDLLLKLALVLRGNRHQPDRLRRRDRRDRIGRGQDQRGCRCGTRVGGRGHARACPLARPRW